MKVMTFDYYYGSQAEQFNFIKIPKTIVVDPIFESLSVNAKLLYGVLLDRMNLSQKNGWFDSENRVYIIYQISEIMEDFNFGKKTAVKYLNELEEFGLIEKKRRGLGLPSLLYVKNFIVQKDYSNQDKNDDMNNSEELCVDAGTSRGVQMGTSRGVQTGTSRSVEMGTSRGVQTGTSGSVEMGTSRSVKRELQEVPKRVPPINKTNMSNTNINQTDNIILSNHIQEEPEPELVDVIRLDKKTEYELYKKLIKKNIDYDALVDRFKSDKGLIDGIVEMMIEVAVCNTDQIVIASNSFPREVVKSRFLKLNMSHIEYVINCFNKNTTKVKNIKKYLLAALYNAPTTIDGFYTSWVHHDMPELTGE